MFRCHNHAGLIAGAMVAASVTLAATASSAMPRYDGLWSVSIVTKKGDCIASYRYPMRIANGVLANGGDIAIDVRGKVAIVLERTPSPQSTSIRLEAYGVTPREREIAILLAQGLTNPEIATRLVLSPYTVQDHIKSLFEKTEVSSRQELVARVFLDEYLPKLAQRTPLTSTGSFIQHPANPSRATLPAVQTRQRSSPPSHRRRQCCRW